MIVEDDDFTRLMIARSLTSEGVQVLAECSNVADALEQARRHQSQNRLGPVKRD